jgi:hypothetical protein
VRSILPGVLYVVLVCGLAPVAFPQTESQERQQAPKPKDQMFSGLVTAIDQFSLTASRTGQGKVAATKIFAITSSTRFEGGKPGVNSRVTVRYVTTEEGETAVHVIVRAGKQ